MDDFQTEVEYNFAIIGLDISIGPDLKDLVSVKADIVDTLVVLAE
ncbi:hypothetical protein [Francisella tularensis]|nr:hypothetical protein [Francisella tularensis]